MVRVWPANSTGRGRKRGDELKAMIRKRLATPMAPQASGRQVSKAIPASRRSTTGQRGSKAWTILLQYSSVWGRSCWKSTRGIGSNPIRNGSKRKVLPPGSRTKLGLSTQRNIDNRSGPAVKNLSPNVDWHVYYFDPATGRKFDQGTIKARAKVDDKSAQPAGFQKNVPCPQDWCWSA